MADAVAGMGASRLSCLPRSAARAGPGRRPNSRETVLLVGHNPGLEELVLLLSTDAGEEEIARAIRSGKNIPRPASPK